MGLRRADTADIGQIREALQLFNEKAAKLEGLSFTKKVRERNPSVTIDLNHGVPVSFERHGPSDEEVEAFVLTFRFFVQDNEPTSLRNLEAFYEAAPVSEQLREDVRDARRVVNEFLDGPSDVRQHGSPIPNRQLFKVFLYGGLAHANRDLKRTYDQWASSDAMFMFLWNSFVNILTSILDVLVWLTDVNNDALKELSGEPHVR